MSLLRMGRRRIVSFASSWSCGSLPADKETGDVRWWWFVLGSALDTHTHREDGRR